MPPITLKDLYEMLSQPRISEAPLVRAFGKYGLNDISFYPPGQDVNQPNITQERAWYFPHGPWASPIGQPLPEGAIISRLPNPEAGIPPEWLSGSDLVMQKTSPNDEEGMANYVSLARQLALAKFSGGQ